MPSGFASGESATSVSSLGSAASSLAFLRGFGVGEAVVASSAADGFPGRPVVAAVGSASGSPWAADGFVAGGGVSRGAIVAATVAVGTAVGGSCFFGNGVASRGASKTSCGVTAGAAAAAREAKPGRGVKATTGGVAAADSPGVSDSSDAASSAVLRVRTVRTSSRFLNCCARALPRCCRASCPVSAPFAVAGS